MAADEKMKERALEVLSRFGGKAQAEFLSWRNSANETTLATYFEQGERIEFMLEMIKCEQKKLQESGTSFASVLDLTEAIAAHEVGHAADPNLSAAHVQEREIMNECLKFLSNRDEISFLVRYQDYARLVMGSEINAWNYADEIISDAVDRTAYAFFKNKCLQSYRDRRYIEPHNLQTAFKTCNYISYHLPDGLFSISIDISDAKDSGFDAAKGNVRVSLFDVNRHKKNSPLDCHWLDVAFYLYVQEMARAKCPSREQIEQKNKEIQEMWDRDFMISDPRRSNVYHDALIQAEIDDFRHTTWFLSHWRFPKLASAVAFLTEAHNARLAKLDDDKIFFFNFLKNRKLSA